MKKVVLAAVIASAAIFAGCELKAVDDVTSCDAFPFITALNPQMMNLSGANVQIPVKIILAMVLLLLVLAALVALLRLAISASMARQSQSIFMIRLLH